MSQFTLLIHGGAGNILSSTMNADKKAAYHAVLESALEAGEAILSACGDALLAVEAAVIVLEDSPLFNAGKGSVYTADGTQEMDAAIMDGRTRDAGAVTCVSHIRNPIRGARAVLEHSPHVLFCGEAADWFARSQNVEWAEAEYFHDAYRWQQLEEIRGSDITRLDFSQEHSDDEKNGNDEPDKYGTVGAVACDAHGHVAAATSTGGMTNKRPGRVGDTPLIGAGVFADDHSCAVSCTGQGEYFMRALVAADVANRMEYGGESVQEAARAAIDKSLTALGGKGGLIAVDAQGNFALPFNTAGMFRAVSHGGGRRDIAMFGEG